MEQRTELFKRYVEAGDLTLEGSGVGVCFVFVGSVSLPKTELVVFLSASLSHIYLLGVPTFSM